MEVISKIGNDLETIIDEICSENNITTTDMYYNYVEKKSGLFNKNVSYEVTAITRDNLVEYIKEFLKELLVNMGLEINFETKIRENLIDIKIYSSNNPVLIGKNGTTLKALEYILKQKISNDFNIKPYLCLDVENYREKQQRRLERLAKNLAKDVVKTNTEVHLENMNAYERRIVHNALTNFKGVKTISEGEEPNRHVVIKPE